MEDTKTQTEPDGGHMENKATEHEKELRGEAEDSPLAIVGIGASAGGLEAMEEFFGHMPAKSGMAFAVVQHQDPDQPSFLPEILQRFTQMPVVEVEENGNRARPDTVYIKPPGADLSILKGTFILLKPTTIFGAKTSIDTFFRHLADDQDGKAVGIILSGMGSDGTLGIRAMKERTGMVMAQEPASSKFGAMPQSAIATGLVDYIASAMDLPRLLCEYVDANMELRKQHGNMTPMLENDLAKIFVLIRARTGQDFTLYKRSTIIRRIERRMGLHQLAVMDNYIRYLRENPAEIDILSKELLIGVTRFFRDPGAWESLLGKALSDLILSRPTGSMLRIWVVGCSTGEEAYSMAIVLQEHLEKLGRAGEIQFQIFATDTERESIDIARTGRYPINIEADVSTERLEKFFIKENGTYRINPHLRESLIFAMQNIILDPPYTHLDIISCRNLLIYLSPELQRKLIMLFHYALNSEGILFLGCAESIGGNNNFFGTVDGKWKIFQKKDVSTASGLPDQPSVFAIKSHAQMVRGEYSASAKLHSLTSIAQQQLLELYAPPAVIVTEDGDIVYFHGRTGKYLEPSPGKANLNIFAMAREGLRYALITLLRTAAAEEREVTAENVALITEDGTSHVRLKVHPISKHSERADLYLAVFEEVPEPKTPQVEPEAPFVASSQDEGFLELRRELAETRSELKRAAEERQASAEEMTSMNEELQSANEELQSTNEELTTSKEELQSLNEELLTVNAELEGKIEAFSLSNDDMQNLLRATEIPMLFLDSKLHVRRFTDAIKPIISLIGNDVGRSVADLNVNLKDYSFVNDAQEVLDTLQFKERQVETPEGDWFSMRIMPYRTSENRINGVVVTFNEITAIKEMERSLRDAKSYSQNIVDTIQEPLLVLNSGMQVVYANRSFYETFRVTPQDTEGRLIYDIGNKQWDISALHQLLDYILPENAAFEGYKVEHDFPEIGKRIVRLNARKIESSKENLILLAMEDITTKRP